MKRTRMVNLRTCCLVLLLLFSFATYCQNRDSLLQIYPSVKDEAERFHLINRILDNPDPKKGLYYHQKLLTLTQKHGDRAGEALVNVFIGWAELLAGNTVTATEIEFKAIRMAEEAGSDRALGWAYLLLSACFSSDASKAKLYLDKSLAASTAANNEQVKAFTFRAIGEYYSAQGKTDSALYFAQQALEVFTTHKLMDDIPTALVSVGDKNYNIGRKGLALEYFRSALREPYIINGDSKENADDKAAIYLALSHFYRQEGRLDPSLHYAQIAYKTVQNISFSYQMGPAYSLWKAYEKNNSDSALKYATLFYSVRDSVYNAGKLQQMQVMALLEDERQRKLKEERSQNLQYAAIAVGVLALLISFLLLSHTVLASQKLIRFLGVVSLLVVFEFLNLFLHPLLGGLTHHSPVLMLLFMVCVAAMLVPLHHKLEHWVIHRLVEKNNRIRLTAAKKTIEKLEGKANNEHLEKSTNAQQQL